MDAPICTIPPDFEIIEAQVQVGTNAASWGVPSSVFDVIWNGPEGRTGVTGKGVIIANLDSGVYSRHRLLQQPGKIIAKRTFVGGDIEDDNGHGCLGPTDEVYTSNCGLQQFQTFFDRMAGVAHFMPDGTIIKDITRYNIDTFSLDISGDLPVAVRRQITHVHKLNYKGDLIVIEVNGEKLSLTPWHPIYVQTSATGKEKRRVKKIRADRLKVGDSVCQIPRNSLSVSDRLIKIPVEVYRSGVKELTLDEDLAFWVGLVVTDEHVTKTVNRITFSSSDPRLMAVFVELSEKIFGKKPSICSGTRDKGHQKATLCGKEVQQAMAAMGVTPGPKSSSLRFPELIAKSPRSVIESFVAGVIEGDGCVGSGRTRVVTASDDFASSLCRLIKTMGVRTSKSLCVSDKSKFGKSRTWHVKIGSWPEMESRLRIKQCKPTAPKPTFTSKIKSIARTFYEGFLYDFTVDGSHNYVANGCVVSNTMTATNSAAIRDSGDYIGVAPDAKLLVGKVFTARGSGPSITDSVRWAADEGAHIINYSGGGGSAYAPTRDAIDYANSKGCIVFCSSGNAGPNSKNWPAYLANNISVGAIQESGRLASFSTTNAMVDVAAPGERVAVGNRTGGISLANGTSFSCPWMSGMAALVLEDHWRNGKPGVGNVDAWRAFIDANSGSDVDPNRDWTYGVPNAMNMALTLTRQLKLRASR